MNLAAVIFGYFTIGLILLATLLCLTAIGIGFVQQLVTDLKPHHDAVVVPLQRPSNVRILRDHTDAS